ncbi:MAG TPA: carotenoid biosynthesis protein [Bacteroidales bacterium]|nr:carotenoid biosynthesis protein [Bacteroidales bacterium]
MVLFKDPTEQYSVIFIVVAFVLDIILHLIPDLRPLIIRLTELNLFLMSSLVFAFGLLNNHRNLTGFTFWSLITMLCTFLLAVTGINTGIFFGSFEYGYTLPTTLADVPLIVPLNWAMLLLSAYGFLTNAVTQRNLRALLASILVLLLNFLIQPVGVKLGYWSWDLGTIPFQNYLSWFVVSLIFTQILAFMKIHARSVIFKTYLIMQFLFYGLLNVFL